MRFRPQYNLILRCGKGASPLPQGRGGLATSTDRPTSFRPQHNLISRCGAAGISVTMNKVWQQRGEKVIGGALYLTLPDSLWDFTDGHVY